VLQLFNVAATLSTRCQSSMRQRKQYHQNLLRLLRV
jgi:hypothetical protein